MDVTRPPSDWIVSLRQYGHARALELEEVLRDLAAVAPSDRRTSDPLIGESISLMLAIKAFSQFMRWTYVQHAGFSESWGLKLYFWICARVRGTHPSAADQSY